MCYVCLVRQKMCYRSNFIFKGCFSVVWRDLLAGVHLTDLAHGFDNGWFCASIRVKSKRNDLRVFWRAFFTKTGKWEEILKKILYCFTLYQFFPDLAHRFYDIPLKLRTKYQNRIPKLWFFNFSHMCRDVEQKNQNFKNTVTLLYKPFYEDFLCNRVLYTKHTFGH